MVDFVSVKTCSSSFNSFFMLFCHRFGEGEPSRHLKASCLLPESKTCCFIIFSLIGFITVSSVLLCLMMEEHPLTNFLENRIIIFFF